MTIIKKVRYYPTLVPIAPCGHLPSVHPTIGGGNIVLLGKPINGQFDYIPGRVWCTDCGWVKIPEVTYKHYKRLNINGITKTRRTD